MIKLFSDFPRELAVPKRVLVFNMDEFINILKENFHRNNIYTSLYSFRNIIESNGRKIADTASAVIDKIFFDFDSPEIGLEDVRKLHRICLENNWMHTMIFSGRGFHFYIMVDPSTSSKSKLATMHRLFSEKYDLSCDRQVFGDVARITRVPNTFNFTRGRFCIPLESRDLSLSYEQICHKASKLNGGKVVFYGNNLFDMSSLPDESYDEEITENFGSGEPLKLEKLNITVPPLIKSILEEKKKVWNKTNGFWQRYVVILTLRELGVSLENCVSLLKEYLTTAEFKHCVFDERQPSRIYRRTTGSRVLYLPSSEWLIKRGFKLTKEDVEFYDNFYLA